MREVRERKEEEVREKKGKRDEKRDEEAAWERKDNEKGISPSTSEQGSS